MRGKNKINLNIEKSKKSRIKKEKKIKTPTEDYKVRFNILTFLTYICRNYYFNEAIFFTNNKWCRIQRNI